MKKLLLPIAVAALLLTGCKKEEVGQRDIVLEFSSAQVGFDAEETTQEISVKLSRKPDQAITATVSAAPEGLEYGTHFTTVPAATDGVIALSVPAGSTTASITVTKSEGTFFDGSETITFTITELSVAEGAKIGEKNSCTLSFGSIVSDGGEMTLEGNGDENYINSVYVDLSGNRQTPVNRKSWNLALWCGEGFHAVLNGAYATAASATAKTDIDAVTLEDADAHQVNLNTAGSMGGDSSVPSPAFDSPDGKLATTVFGEISANDAENTVYFLASAAQKTDSRGDWFKVRVTRKEGGYHVEYGKVSGGNVKSLDIPKRTGYNFVFLSLETGATVDVEPMAAKWDIKWSYDYGEVPMGGALYYMNTQDFVSINNLAGVQVATVLVDNVSYADFAKADIDGLTFEGDRDAIGAKWRVAPMPGVSNPGIDHSCFYVIKDPSGFHYKMRFVRAGISDTGTRGRPEIEYALVN